MKPDKTACLALFIIAACAAFSPAEPTAMSGNSQWRELRLLPTGFQVSRGIAVTAEGRVYAAGDKAVHILGPSGDHVALPLSGEPSCIAVSREGLLYLGLGDHVEVMDHCGGKKASWPRLEDGSVITCVATATEGLWIADAGKRRILKCDPQGRILAEIRKANDSADGDSLVVPSPHLDVAEDQLGRLWVANPGRHRFQVYDGDLRIVKRWGFFSNEAPSGFTGCCNPADFAIMPGGNILAADKGLLEKVRLFDPDGRLLALVADTAAFGKSGARCTGAGLDVAADGQGRVYVLEPAANAVHIFAPVVEKRP